MPLNPYSDFHILSIQGLEVPISILHQCEKGGRSMKDNTGESELLGRLRKIEGQIRGLQRMVTEEAPCRNILPLKSPPQPQPWSRSPHLSCTSIWTNAWRTSERNPEMFRKRPWESCRRWSDGIIAWPDPVSIGIPRQGDQNSHGYVNDHIGMLRGDVMKMEPVGAKEIVSLRTTLRWSQEDLAQEIGVTCSTVRNWEHGYYLTPAKYAWKLRRLFLVADCLHRVRKEIAEDTVFKLLF